MRTIYNVSIICFLFLIARLSAVGQQHPFDHHRFLEWNEFYQLSWDNFQGEPSRGSIGDAGTAVKITAKPYYKGRKIAYDVHALFDRKNSWFKEKDVALLAHEQLHFDIAELYARRIRKKVAELSLRNERDLKQYNLEINKLLEESNVMDLQYDMETLHGGNIRKQKMWKEKIDRELERLIKYKKSKTVIGD